MKIGNNPYNFMKYTNYANWNNRIYNPYTCANININSNINSNNYCTNNNYRGHR